MTWYTHDMHINKVKYENLILYLADKLGGEIRGKKKLAKLLYFADFDFFEKYERPITGDLYKALPMGPFPTHMMEIIEALEAEQRIVKSSVPEGPNNPTEIYHGAAKPDLAVFSAEELQMIDRVVEKYGKLTGKQLEDLSHAEAPYIATEPNKEIIYELAFYRGTDSEHA